MKDYSIEYAHIYSNQEIALEHELSLSVLQEVQRDIPETESSSLVVLVDDYSFPDHEFDYEAFTAWLSEKGYAPDLVVKESALIPACDLVLAVIGDRGLKKELVQYINSKKYPCSLFIAAWYLLRLGYIKHNIFPRDLQAKKLITILPESFKPYEDRGLAIIKATPFSEALLSIKHRYFEGRDI